jgi:hypothetical protein
VSLNAQVPQQEWGRGRRLDSDLGAGAHKGDAGLGRGERVDWRGAGLGDVGVNLEEDQDVEEEEEDEVDWFRVSTGAGLCPCLCLCLCLCGVVCVRFVASSPTGILSLCRARAVFCFVLSRSLSPSYDMHPPLHMTCILLLIRHASPSHMTMILLLV